MFLAEETVTDIPLASAVVFTENHANEAVDIITAETRSMASAGRSLRESFIVFLLSEFYFYFFVFI